MVDVARLGLEHAGVVFLPASSMAGNGMHSTGGPRRADSNTANVE